MSLPVHKKFSLCSIKRADSFHALFGVGRLPLRRLAQWGSALFLSFTLITSAFPEEQKTIAVELGERPDRVERIISAGPVSDLFLISLAPEKLLGLSSSRMAKTGAQFLPEVVTQLKELGRLSGRASTLSTEKILALSPDLIIDLGTVGPTYISTAQRIHEQTGIPYILVDGDLTKSAQQLREVGVLLGVEENAERLATFTEALFLKAEKVRKSLEGSPIRLYSARGNDGLETALAGSIHTEVIELLGAVNVAEEAGESRIANISHEQLMLWDPDLIITQDAHFYQYAQHSPLWRSLRAVREGKLLLIPETPFGWLDRPPGINRLLGMILMMHYFAPELYPRSEAALDIERYFALFYRHRLSSAQVQQFLPQKENRAETIN